MGPDLAMQSLQCIAEKQNILQVKGVSENEYHHLE